MKTIVIKGEPMRVTEDIASMWESFSDSDKEEVLRIMELTDEQGYWVEGDGFVKVLHADKTDWIIQCAGCPKYFVGIQCKTCRKWDSENQTVKENL